MFFFQAEDGIRDADVTGVQTCALPISLVKWVRSFGRRKNRRPAGAWAAVFPRREAPDALDQCTLRCRNSRRGNLLQSLPEIVAVERELGMSPFRILSRSHCQALPAGRENSGGASLLYAA